MAPLKNLYTNAGSKPGRGATRGSTRGSRTRASTRGTIMTVEDSTPSAPISSVTQPAVPPVSISAPASVPQVLCSAPIPTPQPAVPPAPIPAPQPAVPPAPISATASVSQVLCAAPIPAPQPAVPPAPISAPMVASIDSKRTWRRLKDQEANTRQLQSEVKGLKEDVEQLKKKLEYQEKENEKQSKTASSLAMPVYYGYQYHPYTRPLSQQHVPVPLQVDNSPYQPVPHSYTVPHSYASVAPPQLDHVLQPLQQNQPTPTQSTYPQYQYNHQ